MNCNDCLQLVATADVADQREIDAVLIHCHTCDDCARTLDNVRLSAVRVAEALDAIPPGVASPLVARRAAAEAAMRRERGRRWRLIGYPLGAAALAAVVFGMRIAPGLTRSGPPVEQHFIWLRCMSGAQAASLLGPRLGKDGSVQISSDGARLEIWGSPIELAKAESLIDQYDNERVLPPGGTCLLPSDPAQLGAGAAAEAMARQQEAIAREHESIARQHEEQARQQEAITRQQEAVQRAREDAQRAQEARGRGRP